MTDKDNYLINFLEEISWLISTYSKEDLKSLPRIVSRLKKYSNQNRLLFDDLNQDNIHYLVGVLPKLLLNEKIFPSNFDIAEFSEKVLGLSINRFEKISRYEIIGHIVCNVNNLDNDGFNVLVRALKKIDSDDKKIEKIIMKNSNSKYAWNNLIQEIIKQNE